MKQIDKVIHKKMYKAIVNLINESKPSIRKMALANIDKNDIAKKISLDITEKVEEVTIYKISDRAIKRYELAKSFPPIAYQNESIKENEYLTLSDLYMISCFAMSDEKANDKDGERLITLLNSVLDKILKDIAIENLSTTQSSSTGKTPNVNTDNDIEITSQNDESLLYNTEIPSMKWFGFYNKVFIPLFILANLWGIVRLGKNGVVSLLMSSELSANFQVGLIIMVVVNLIIIINAILIAVNLYKCTRFGFIVNKIFLCIYPGMYTFASCSGGNENALFSFILIFVICLLFSILNIIYFEKRKQFFTFSDLNYSKSIIVSIASMILAGLLFLGLLTFSYGSGYVFHNENPKIYKEKDSTNYNSVMFDNLNKKVKKHIEQKINE